MKLTKDERNILIEIFKSSNGLYLFTIYRQLKISPKNLFLSIENLKLNGIIDVIEDRVNLTKKGVDYSTKIPLKIKSETTTLKMINKDHQGKRININEFYIPRNFEK